MPVRDAVGRAQREVADRLVLCRTVHVHDPARDDDDAALLDELSLLAGELDEAAAEGEVDLDEDFGDSGDSPPLHPNCMCEIELFEPDEEDDDE